MKPVRLRFAAKLAVALIAAIPVFAQTPDASADILQGVSYPPLQRLITPDAGPDAGPTSIFPGKMKVAYGFNAITNHGAGQTIAIVDAFDEVDPKGWTKFGRRLDSAAG